jgi:cation transport ATPase
MHRQKWFKRGLVVALSIFVLAWLVGQAGVQFLEDVAALPVWLPLLATFVIVGLRLPIWRRAADNVRFTATDDFLINTGTGLAVAGGLVAGFSSGFFLEGVLRFNGYVVAGLGLFAVGLILMAIPKGKR